MLQLLERLVQLVKSYLEFSRSEFPINKLIPLATCKIHYKIEYMNKEVTVLELTETVFEENDVEIAFFSAGGSVSEKFAKFAVEASTV